MKKVTISNREPNRGQTYSRNNYNRRSLAQTKKEYNHARIQACFEKKQGLECGALNDLVSDIKSIHPEYTSKDILEEIMRRGKVDEIVRRMNAIHTPLMGSWNTTGGTQKKLKSRRMRRGVTRRKYS